MAATAWRAARHVLEDIWVPFKISSQKVR